MGHPVTTRFSLIVAFAFIFVLILFNFASFRLSPSVTESLQLSAKSFTYDENTSIRKGKCMVMCVGNDASLIGGARYIIQQLRGSWKSLLPVSINHCNELTAETQTMFGSFENVTVKNLCDENTPIDRKKKLRGWFCKTMALVSSECQETIVVDTDVLWFKDPSQLFDAPGYLRSGALFFRDRFLHVSATEKDGLEVASVSQFIESESKASIQINTSTVKTLAESNGINFFWYHSLNGTKSSAIRHVQESSVLVVDKSRLPKTMHILSRLLHDFHLGYGDKEIYWIAATIAQEDFSFEPYLAGSYGDCGEILHFDPLSTSTDAEPYFLNCQFLSEGVDHVGKNLQEVISRPVLITPHTKIFNMGEKDKKSAGRCGSCKAMGCGPVPPNVNAAIQQFQEFQIQQTKTTFLKTFYKKLSNFFSKLLNT